MEEIRDCFVSELSRLKKEDERIFVLVSDSTSTCRIGPFMEAFPDSVINTGIAEQNMIGIAAGMSLGGLIPFTANAAPFLMGRSNEQVKTDICYSNTNVKLVGLNPGFAYGALGPTHHCLDDISTTLAFGNISIFAPSDPVETREITRYAASCTGPVYIRLDSFRADNVHPADYKFIPGETSVIREGADISLITLGTIVHEAVAAAELLAEKGLEAEIISLPSIRPLNPEGIINSLKKTGAALTLEEHSTHGGIGSIVGEIILDNRLSCILKRNGVPSGTFAEAAPRPDLKKSYGLDTDGIIASVEVILKEKQGK